MSPGDDQPATFTNLEVGEVLDGTFRLEEKIGEGGMGRVFRATDLKTPRQVAVKALTVTNLADETVKRFERESRVMSTLDHPGVVPCYGTGSTRGIPWLAMRLLAGKSLVQVLEAKGGRLTLTAAMPIVRQLLDTLGYLHGKGLIHRDLKPSNIHLAVDGKVTLCDLGLTRGHQSELTRTGVVWGTPSYMSPEQAVGEKELDARSDLYSLAVVLFRLLAGAGPFPEDNPQQMMKAHLSRARPDLSRVVTSVPVAFGAALKKAMAVEPDHRFQTAAELGAALEAALTTPVLEEPTNPVAEPLTELVLESPVARRATLETEVVSVATQTPLAGTRPEGFRSRPPLDPLDDFASEAATRRAAFTALPVKAGSDEPATRRDGFNTLPASSEPAEAATHLVSAQELAQALNPPPKRASTPSDSTLIPVVRTPAYQRPEVLIIGAVLLVLLGVLVGSRL